MLLVLLVGLASAGVVREAERSTRSPRPGRDRTGWPWEGVDRGDWAPHAEWGRVLWHERDTLLHSALLSQVVGSVPANSDPEQEGGSRWGGRRW
jgi:hypothetical protein